MKFFIAIIWLWSIHAYSDDSGLNRTCSELKLAFYCYDFTCAKASQVQSELKNELSFQADLQFLDIINLPEYNRQHGLLTTEIKHQVQYNPRTNSSCIEKIISILRQISPESPTIEQNTNSYGHEKIITIFWGSKK